jgi:hypothetical protein
MKLWLALLAGGVLLVTAWARTIPLTTPYGDPSMQRFNTAESALRRAEYAYREFAREDSLLPLLPSAPGVSTALAPQLRAVHADSIRAMLAQEVAAIDSVRARIGVFVVDAMYGSRAGIWSEDGREIYAGSDSAGDYCAVVVVAQRQQDGTLATREFGVDSVRRALGSTVLGPCAFHARYGAPGAGIAQWLRGGGYRLADLRPSEAGRALARAAAGGLFGIGTAEGMRLRGCRGGREEMCRDLVMMRDTTSRDGRATANLDRWYTSDMRITRSLLHAVEQQFGPERFAAFWTSDADVETAFSAAFDRELAVWVQEWARSGARSPLAARVDAVTLLLCVLVLGALGAGAAVVAARREVV